MSKNKDTQRIPILVDEGFIKLHPGVMSLADENTVGVRSQYPEVLQEELENGLIDQNPLILGYPATNQELESSIGDTKKIRSAGAHLYSGAQQKVCLEVKSPLAIVKGHSICTKWPLVDIKSI